MTRSQCVDLLGSPEDWGRGKRKENASIYKWSGLEFHFSEEELFLVWSDTEFDLRRLFGDGFDWPIKPERIQRLFEEYEICFTESQKQFYDQVERVGRKELSFKLENDLTIYFLDEAGEYTLHTIEQFLNRPQTP